MNYQLILFLIFLYKIKKVDLKCKINATKENKLVTSIMATDSNVLTSSFIIQSTFFPFNITSILFTSRVKITTESSSSIASTFENISKNTTETNIFTPMPIIYQNCSILYGTVGINKSGQNHPIEVYSINNETQCCEKCQSYLNCTIFIFSINSQQCFIFNKISWTKLKFLQDKKHSIGKII